MGIIDVTAFNREEKYEASNKILTLPNVITFARICLIPVYLVLLFGGNDLAAAILFAITAGTDFLDGQIARRTNSVSRLGQFLDPLTDRLLMISVVIGLLVIGRLPLWIIIIVVLRDLYLLIGGSYLLKAYQVRVAVIYLGKIATALMFFGCAFLLLNWPLIPGLNMVDFAWLPGFTGDAACLGIWLVYVGLLLAIITTIYYTCKGVQGIHVARARKDDEKRSFSGNSRNDGESLGAASQGDES